ncbi:MAG TPA: energy transducer TonB [Terracidiphilus sp.]|nr:energy transducer TonB [Terracidiphilus sp.]
MRRFPLLRFIAEICLLAAGLSAAAQAPASGTAQPVAEPSQASGVSTPPQDDTVQTTATPSTPAAPADAVPQSAPTAPAPADAAPQQPAPAQPSPDATPVPTTQEPAQEPTPAAAQEPTPNAAQEPTASDAKDSGAGAITEDELKQSLVGKTLYLRGGYLDNSLSFDEHGKLIGHSPQGSYTLNLVVIDKVHLSKHKAELTGSRYGLHFLGARPDEDPTKAVDKVRITPKKKVVKITIDRELVVTPKKKKAKKGEEPATNPATTASAATSATSELSDADQAKAEMNAAPEAERPADAGSVTTTTSPAHAAHLMRDALDQILAQGLDDRMIASMPSFWKLYYDAVAKQADYKPADPAIYRQGNVDQKAKLLSTFEPASNEYAQASGVAGMALYHAVIGPDGKPAEIVVGRPIGFGLDESAADTIRKANFQPAMKDGKPVAVVLDLVVQFRIYSKRTDQAAKPEIDATYSGPKLPGPYSVTHP